MGREVGAMGAAIAWGIFVVGWMVWMLIFSIQALNRLREIHEAVMRMAYPEQAERILARRRREIDPAAGIRAQERAASKPPSTR
jgi:hypothetical protein